MDCYICKEIEEYGYFEHVCPGEHVRVTIEKNSKGNYIYMARGYGYVWDICNYCPQCGRQLNKKEGEE